MAGEALHRLGVLAVERLRVRELAHSSLVALARQTGETCELAVLDGSDVLLIDVAEGTHSLRVVDPVGTRAPAHLTAVGKAMLASLTEVELEERVRDEVLEVRTPHSVGSRARLWEQLSEVRVRGYASAVSELGDDYVGVAAPVVGPDGTVVAGLTVALPVVRATEHFASTIGPHVVAAADGVAARLAEEATR